MPHLDETRRDAAMVNESHKKCIKVKYERSVKFGVFSKGDLIL